MKRFHYVLAAFSGLAVIAALSVIFSSWFFSSPLIAAQCSPPREGTHEKLWNFSVWHKKNVSFKKELAALKTSQSGKSEPAVFIGKDWKKEVGEFRLAWQKFIGDIPVSCAPLDPREEQFNLTNDETAKIPATVDLKKVSFRGAHGEVIPAFLFIPKNLKKPAPAILALHQSSPECAKKEPAGLCGLDWLGFAKVWAEKGFITLAPDTIGYGERSKYLAETGSEYADAAPLLSRFPKASLMGLFISDNQRAIDFLETLPQVDKARIGVIGHSLGGINSLFLAAFEPRVRCAVSNAGPNLVRRETLAEMGLSAGVSRWAGFGYIPSFAFYDKKVKDLPVEIHQLYAMVAPRGLFVSVIEDDSVSPKNDRAGFVFSQAARAHKALKGNFASYWVRTGLTSECKREWAAPVCLATNYDACLASGDTGCLTTFAKVGISAACIADHGTASYDCTKFLWDACIKKKGESLCLKSFAAAGLTKGCIQKGFDSGCRRDHGWYPEVEEKAYPWLEKCLKK